MGFRIWRRGELIYRKQHNRLLVVDPFVDSHRKPVLSIHEERIEGNPPASTDITTFSHLDELFEGLLVFERYGSAIQDQIRDYALNKGIKVSTISCERFR